MTTKMLVGIKNIPFKNPVIAKLLVNHASEMLKIKAFCSQNIQASWGFSNICYDHWMGGQAWIYFCFSEESDFMILKLFANSDIKRADMWPSSASFTFKIFEEQAKNILQTFD